MPANVPLPISEHTLAKGVGLIAKSEGNPMLSDYIDAAMEHATYEKLDDAYYYGEIPGIWGAYAHETTLEETRRELTSVHEDWILIGLRKGEQLPGIDGIDLSVRHVA